MGGLARFFYNGELGNFGGLHGIHYPSQLLVRRFWVGFNQYTIRVGGLLLA
jgi:hypothetical protein